MITVRSAASANAPVVTRRPLTHNEVNPRPSPRKNEHIDRSTSPVDARILEEFYADHPKDMHQYNLEGRQYVVYEGKTFSDAEPIRKGKLERAGRLLSSPLTSV